MPNVEAQVCGASRKTHVRYSVLTLFRFTVQTNPNTQTVQGGHSSPGLNTNVPSHIAEAAQQLSTRTETRTQSNMQEYCDWMKKEKTEEF